MKKRLLLTLVLLAALFVCLFVTAQAAQMPQAADPRWGQTADGASVPGMVSWTNPGGDWHDYLVEFYLENQIPGTDEPAFYDYVYGNGARMECDLFLQNCTWADSGRYFFTVTNRGYGDNTDSEPVRSALWQYTKPATYFEWGSDPTWYGDKVLWTPPANCGGYMCRFLWTAEAKPANPWDGVYAGDTAVWGPVSGQQTIPIPEDAVNWAGPGYYWAVIASYPLDINQKLPAYGSPSTACCQITSTPMTRGEFCQRFMEAVGGTYETGVPNLFSDLSENDRYYKGVMYCLGLQMVNGMKEGSVTKFNAGGNMTRAEVAMALSRLSSYLYNAGCYKKPFTDVDSGAWYKDAAEKVVNVGWMRYTNTAQDTFSPEALATADDVRWDWLPYDPSGGRFLPSDPLDDPTDLQWGWTVDVSFQRNETTHLWEEVCTDRVLPGAMRWKAEGECEEVFHVQVYKDGVAEPVFDRTNLYLSKQGDWYIYTGFLEDVYDSGTYRFQVQSIGRNNNNRRSYWVSSGDFEYVNPGVSLPAPENLTWVGTTLTWDQDDLPIAAEMGRVAMYYTNIDDVSAVREDQSRTYGSGSMPSECRHTLDFYTVERGDGKYLFAKVGLMSSDITQYTGVWSSCSPALRIETATGQVNSILSSIPTDPAQVNAKVNEIRGLDTEKLRLSLELDGTEGASSTVADKLKQLEQRLGVTTTVQVAEQVTDETQIEASKVSVVGAGLNTGASKSLTVNIAKADTGGLAIGDQYSAQRAVGLSITVTGLSNSAQLDVPVKITMPVPGGLAANRLVVLHYHGAGAPEVIYPQTYWDNSAKVTMATFTLTGFSNFVFTEQKVGKELKPEMFTVDLSDADYTGSPIRRDVTPAEGLVEGTDYVVNHYNNDGPGVATIVISGRGQYANSEPLNLHFNIYNTCTGTIMGGLSYKSKENYNTRSFVINGEIPAGQKLYAATYETGWGVTRMTAIRELQAGDEMELEYTQSVYLFLLDGSQAPKTPSKTQVLLPEPVIT